MYELTNEPGDKIPIYDNCVMKIGVKEDQIYVEITTSEGKKINGKCRVSMLSLLENKSQENDIYLRNVKLTKREEQCLGLYLQGMTIKEISEKIVRSYRTAETHIKNIREKLQANSRSEVFVKAKKKYLLRGGMQ